MRKSRIDTLHLRRPNPLYLAFRSQSNAPDVNDRLAHFDETWHVIRKVSQRRRLLSNN